jgi:hypothetical protein
MSGRVAAAGFIRDVADVRFVTALLLLVFVRFAAHCGPTITVRRTGAATRMRVVPGLGAFCPQVLHWRARSGGRSGRGGFEAACHGAGQSSPARMGGGSSRTSELDCSSGQILGRCDACEGYGMPTVVGDDGTSAQNGIAGKASTLSHGEFRLVAVTTYRTSGWRC